MNEDDPLRPAKGILNAMVFGLILWLAIIMLTRCAMANDDLILNGKETVSLNRPS